MPLVFSSNSDENVLKFILGKEAAPTSQTLRLFKNNYTPSKNSVLSEITEVSESGYLPIVLSNSDWSIGTVSGSSYAASNAKTFNINENVIIYGYYVTININSVESLFWIEKFAGSAYEIPIGGGSISISLSLNAS